ncbi:pilus assembly protein TadG-related protein [Nocardiopsis salina]|uniref:pilus assembly protein TadG-related protein n=1 Tax=Nocardiopsis salina TaxID=245836 RepID=UPI000377EC9D|nr:pilus assembly protein TadG-related protein [Nocardiopsis salina]
MSWGRGSSAERDAGNASVFLILLIPVVTLVFALVWEAGQMLVAKSDLLEATHAAARAGAHQVDTSAVLAHGETVLAPQAAERAATEHLVRAGVSGRAEADGEQVVILARTTYTPALLPIGSQVIEAEANAVAVQPSG